MLRMFSTTPLYVRVTRSSITIRDIEHDRTHQFDAIVGIRDDKVVSFGQPVSADADRTVRPFEHPRLVIGDFVAAEKAVTLAIRESNQGKWFIPAPIVLIQAEMDLAGGITNIEDRVLREIAEGAGARKVFTHFGHVLSDDEVRSFGSREA